MKKLKALLVGSIITTISFCMVACGGSDSSTANPDTASEGTVQSTVTSTLLAQTEQSITVDSVELTKDINGNDAVKVYFAYQNNSSEAVAYMSAFVTKVFQNGVECDMATLEDNSSENGVKDVKDGGKLTVMISYELETLTDSIEVNVIRLDDGVTVVEKTFDLQNSLAASITSSEAQDPTSAAVTNGFEVFEKGLSDLGLTYTERVTMAADLIGGISGYKYKMGSYNIELYQFDPNGDAYHKAEADGSITLESFGVFPVYTHNGFVMMGGDFPQEVMDLFNRL